MVFYINIKGLCTWAWTLNYEMRRILTEEMNENKLWNKISRDFLTLLRDVDGLACGGKSICFRWKIKRADGRWILNTEYAINVYMLLKTAFFNRLDSLDSVSSRVHDANPTQRLYTHRSEELQPKWTITGTCAWFAVRFTSLQHALFIYLYIEEQWKLSSIHHI